MPDHSDEMTNKQQITFRDISQERLRELAEIARQRREEVQTELDRLKILTERDLQYRID